MHMGDGSWHSLTK